MTSCACSFDRQHRTQRATSPFIGRLWPLWVSLLWLISACAHLAPFSVPRDPAAAQVIADIKQTNPGLLRFKCVGKITVSIPQQSTQSYRSAIAGQLKDHLRIDLFAPFGGAAGTVASDGRHLFLVLHASRDYYKKRFGEGSLDRFIKMNVTVGDLLELLVGRIPLEPDLVPQIVSEDDTDRASIRLVDRRGRIRQRIALNADGRPFAVQWFDIHDRQTISLSISGHQVVEGFVLPKRVDLLAATGQSVSFILERYEANPHLEEGLFAPPPISS